MPDPTSILTAATETGRTRKAFNAATERLRAVLAEADHDTVNVSHVAEAAGTTRKTIYRMMGKDY